MGLGTLTLFVFFVFVAVYANRLQNTTASRAAGISLTPPTTASSRGTPPAPMITSTGFSPASSSPSAGTNSSGSAPTSCADEKERVIIGCDGNPIKGHIDIGTAQTMQVSHMRFVCADGSTETFPSSPVCITAMELGKQFTAAIATGYMPCKGKSAGCPAGGSITPAPTAINNLSVTPIRNTTPTASCTTKSNGDANCDGRVDLVDFNQWLTGSNAAGYNANIDFNGDGKVSLADFEVWRGTFTNAR